jgi:hypothetical protein
LSTTAATVRIRTGSAGAPCALAAPLGVRFIVLVGRGIARRRTAVGELQQQFCGGELRRCRDVVAREEIDQLFDRVVSMHACARTDAGSAEGLPAER